MAKQPRRQLSSYLLPREPEISEFKYLLGLTPHDNDFITDFEMFFSVDMCIIIQASSAL
jgi:hypothetical protein